jgi:hypothetical protein
MKIVGWAQGRGGNITAGVHATVVSWMSRAVLGPILRAGDSPAHPGTATPHFCGGQEISGSGDQPQKDLDAV